MQGQIKSQRVVLRKNYPPQVHSVAMKALLSEQFWEVKFCSVSLLCSSGYLALNLSLHFHLT